MTKKDIYNHWQKYQKGAFENNFLVMAWISSKLNNNLPYSLWFNFMSLGHVLAKLLSIWCQVNIWHQTVRTQCISHFTAAARTGPPANPGSACTSRLSYWKPSQLSEIAGNYSKCMWQAQKRQHFRPKAVYFAIFSWAGTFVCRQAGI